MVSALLTPPCKSVLLKSIVIGYSPYLDLFFQSEKGKKINIFTKQVVIATADMTASHQHFFFFFLIFHLATYRIAPSLLFF